MAGDDTAQTPVQPAQIDAAGLSTPPARERIPETGSGQMSGFRDSRPGARYDPEADALYITIRPIPDGGAVHTRQLTDQVHLDHDGAGNILGVEVLNPTGGHVRAMEGAYHNATQELADCTGPEAITRARADERAKVAERIARDLEGASPELSVGEPSGLPGVLPGGYLRIARSAEIARSHGQIVSNATGDGDQIPANDDPCEPWPYRPCEHIRCEPYGDCQMVPYTAEQVENLRQVLSRAATRRGYRLHNERDPLARAVLDAGYRRKHEVLRDTVEAWREWSRHALPGGIVDTDAVRAWLEHRADQAKRHAEGDERG